MSYRGREKGRSWFFLTPVCHIGVEKKQDLDFSLPLSIWSGKFLPHTRVLLICDLLEIYSSQLFYINNYLVPIILLQTLYILPSHLLIITMVIETLICESARLPVKMLRSGSKQILQNSAMLRQIVSSDKFSTVWVLSTFLITSTKMPIPMNYVLMSCHCIIHFLSTA